jgi:hypothetical protein
VPSNKISKPYIAQYDYSAMKYITDESFIEKGARRLKREKEFDLDDVKFYP